MQNPYKCRGFTSCYRNQQTATLYHGQKYATINCNACAILVLVGTTVSSPHLIGSPVYTTHSASKTSEQVSGSGHPIGVGHGAGDVNAESEHPHFLHPQVVQVLVAIV